MNDFWQENKRLVTLAGSGLLVFLIAYLVIDGLYGDKARQVESSVRTLRSKLAKEQRYSSKDRDAAIGENEALLVSLGDLAARTDFRPRPEFVLPPGSAGTASTEYFKLVEQVRDELTRLAGRKRIVLPQGLDLELLGTNAVDVIERHVAALDQLDRVLRLAIEHDVKQIKSIRIELDPSFRARRGMGPIEETTILVEAVSAPGTITDWLQATQTLEFGQVAPIRALEARATRAKSDELRVKVTFSVVRLHLSEELSERLPSVTSGAGDAGKLD